MRDIRRLAGLFLLAALAAQGIPLDGQLSISVHPGLDEMRDLLLARIEGIGGGGSPFRMLFWLALYAGSILLLLFRFPQSAMTVLRRNLFLVFLVALIPLSVLWSANPRIVATNSAHSIGVLAIAVAAAISYRDRPVALARDLSYVLGANVLLHLVTVVLIPEYTINWAGRWRGLWNHPNNLGRIAFCALAMNASYLAVTKDRKTWVHVGLIAGSVLALIGTQSKTSSISAVIAGIGPVFLVWVYKNYGRRGAWQVVLWSSLLATIVALPIIFYAQELLEAFTSAIGRDASFTGRTDIWAAAIAAIGEKPFTGWSFDSHLEIITNTALRFDTYHNGYLDIMVSGGVGALVLFVFFIAQYFTRMKNSEPSFIILFLPISIAILIHNVFEAGILTGRGTIWIILIVIVLMQSTVAAETSRRQRAFLRHAKRSSRI